MKYGIWCELLDGKSKVWAENSMALSTPHINNKFDTNIAQFSTTELNAAFQYLDYLKDRTGSGWIMCVREFVRK